MVHTLAEEVMTLNEKITETDKLIEGRLHEHHLAEVITSMPGIGPTPGAEFLAAVGGSLDASPTVDRLAAFAGVSPAPRVSGRSAAISTTPSGTTGACNASSTLPR
ncbi:Transposase IS116/IS110/IS902 family protein (plasmid) [Streptomyces sp. YIM 121038]|nr:Transposase IS116/IS110/IS902 family protein [Streptomyces sp. YIM 121038]